jgi:hypothetical protein
MLFIPFMLWFCSSSEEDEDIDISSLDEEEYPETWEEAYRLADNIKKKKQEESDDEGTESEDIGEFLSCEA